MSPIDPRCAKTHPFSRSSAILTAYYSSVTPLIDYLLLLEPHPTPHARSTRDALLSTDDDAKYIALLTRSLVAMENPILPPRRKIPACEPCESMSEVIDSAQARLFKLANGKPTNVITSGYRPADSRNEHGKVYGNRAWITNFFVNTLVTALKAPEWELLLRRIGSSTMLHLLTQTSIFVSLPNDCLCQLTGVPLVQLKQPGTGTLIIANADRQNPGIRVDESRIHLKRKPEASDDDGPRKKAKIQKSLHVKLPDLEREQSSAARTKRTPSYIPLIRARLFYSRPFKIGQMGRIAMGLPPTHVLNRLNHNVSSRATSPSAPHSVQDKRSDHSARLRHLSKYIFPRQFGLSNAFETTERGNETRSYNPPTKNNVFDERDSEIKTLGSIKTPKRLKWALELLETLTSKHQKCNYEAILNRICPSKVKDNLKNSLDSSIILELVSEDHIDIKTQLSELGDRSAFSAVSAHGPSFARSQLRHKPKFVEFTCTHVQVYLFARSITRRVIPKAFWGSQANFRTIMNYTKLYISRRRYETITLHGVMQGLKTSECDWVLPPTKLGKQQRPSVSESNKRRELLEEFVYWYFEFFLLPLLKTNFYVTESSAFRNKVLYFRQDDWDTLCRPLLDRLAGNTFQKIPQTEAEQLLKQRSLGFSFVRLLPKDTGVRPIVNLRRRTKPDPADKYARSQSINQVLQATFQILSYEKEVQPAKLGASVFGHNEVYLKLKAFKTNLNNRHGHIPKLYFVKLDVQACFDNIEQNRLLEILKKLITEDAYMIRRHGQVDASTTTAKIRRTFVRKARPETEHAHFLAYATQLAALLRHIIFVDMVVYPYAFRDHILGLLEDHITSNIVKIGDDYYRQMVGIPQGSVLSSILCSFFYGDLENTRLRFISDDPDSMLLRLIDDYLLVTTDVAHARQFLEEMNRGHPDYGCFIAKEKTLTNFDHGPILSCVLPKQIDFPWCGYRINIADLSVSVDYSRFHPEYVMDSLTVHRGRNPGLSFTRKMLQLAKHRTHIIFCDTTHNSRSVVHANIYENFVILAMKMHRYLKDWGIDLREKGNARLVKETVRQTIYYTYASIRDKARNGVVKQGMGKCCVNKAVVVWLGSHAYYTVLARKFRESGDEHLTSNLAFTLALPRNRAIEKKLLSMTKSSLLLMSALKY